MYQPALFSKAKNLKKIFLCILNTVNTGNIGVEKVIEALANCPSPESANSMTKNACIEECVLITYNSAV
ncbi:hypothetical protein XENTR_v10008746 [Xenopus tropicalis]|nr:hypothetical protein XENTR_v10008746 [Xenopus tropicalis]